MGAHLVATHQWQVTVQDDHVVVMDERPLQPGIAVEGQIHGHLLAPQPHAECLGELTIVVNHEHTHATASRLRSFAEPRSCTRWLRASCKVAAAWLKAGTSRVKAGFPRPGPARDRRSRPR